MLAKAAHDMVVLAVHIHRDCTANCGKASARHHRRKPSLGRENTRKLADANAGFHFKNTCFQIKIKDSIKPGHDACLARIVQRRVTVATAISDGGAFRGDLADAFRAGE